MNQPTIIWCSYLSTATVTATDSASGYTAGDILYATEDTGHKFANTTGTKTYTIDLGESRTIDCVALLGVGLDGVTVEVRGSTDNFSSSNVQLKTGTALAAINNAAWLSFTNSTLYRYFRLSISGFGSNFKVNHVAFDKKELLPYFETDPGLNNISTDGSPILSQAGYFLGSAQKKSMRNMSLNFGVVMAADITDILTFAEECIATLNPFFVVPDTDDTDVYFCWSDDGEFSADYLLGDYRVAPITVVTRAA